LPDTLLAVAAMLIIVSAIQPLARRLLLSDAVLLALVGILIGAGSAFVLRRGPTSELDKVAATFAFFPVNAQIFLTVFLPALVFDGALSIDVRRLARDIAPVLVLAVVAVVATTAAIGAALAPIGGQPLVVCLLLGAIVATTDPSAVIGVFRTIGADARLTRLVEGESLLNDATAIALFTLLLDEATQRASSDFSTVGFTLAALFIGGAVVGHVLARLALAAMPLLGDSRTAEVTLTIALPYVSYIVCSDFLGFSGVVAAAAAGLTVSAIGPSVLRPRSWSYLIDVWAQITFLASSLVFMLASMLVPRLMFGVTAWDFLLIGVSLVAAMAARAAVLFLLMPILRYTRLTRRIPLRFKLTMWWGGLRGSITLAMALAVTEDPGVSGEVQQFVAILATGFVLFTLLVNGTTLRLLVRRLGLDQLSPIDQALRHQVVALELGEVRDRLAETAKIFEFLPAATHNAVEYYAQRAAAEAAANSFDAALTDRDRLRLGLLTFAAQERTILLEIFRDRGVSHRIMALLLRTADVIIDSTRADGRLGYLRAARRRLRPSVLLRGAQLLNYWVRVDRPLTLLMGQRFTMLLVMRLVFLAQLRFLQQRMTPVLGVRVTEVLGDIVQRRRSLLDDAMDAMGKLYPGHAETLQAAMLTQIGLRFETNAYAALRDEALLSDELFEEIQRDIEARRDATGWPVLPDLPGALARRLAALPRFDRLPADLLEKITRQVNMRFVLPGERILRRRERDGAVYVISSGEVEIEHANRTVRLAGGEMFGGDGMLGAAQTQGAVTATRYCHLLVLRSRFFRTLSAGWPVLISADRMVGVPM
jgi:CPA1 family monovalent cation:H+ antiporter